MDSIELIKNILISNNVLYLKGKPGIGKSAIAAKIAKENGWEYYDLRLSQRDESEIGGLPFIGHYEENGSNISYTDYALPKWFVKALNNKNGMLVHFEELNRCSRFVRNACLEILNERTLNGYKLPDNVYLMASGNLGEEDGTDVDELTTEIKNRMCIISYNPSVNDWIKEYANENVHESIVSFIKTYPLHYYYLPNDVKNGTSSIDTFATPRSWTNLSKFITTLEKQNNIAFSDSEILKIPLSIITGYVGISAIEYMDFLKKRMKLGIYDILNNYNENINKIKELTRTDKIRLIDNFKTIDILNLSEYQSINMCEFLHTLDKDEIMSLISWLFDQIGVYIDPVNGNAKCVFMIKIREEFIDILNDYNSFLENRLNEMK